MGAVPDHGRSEMSRPVLVSSVGTRPKLGPTNSTQAIVPTILEIKSRYPGYGNQRHAEQMSPACAVPVDNDVVRPVLATHHRPDHLDHPGRSGIDFIARTTDGPWSVDLFRCEPFLLCIHRARVAIEIFTRRIVGPGFRGEHLDHTS